MKSVGTYYVVNAIKQLMQRQMQYIRCNKAIHNTYDAMKQNITNKTWRSIMINPDHLPDAPICCFHFCCKQFVSNAHSRCLNQRQQAVWTCQLRNWTQLQLFSSGGVEGGEGDVGSSASSPDSHWCVAEKGSPQLWQFSSLLDRERGELLRAELIRPGPLSFSGEAGAVADVSRGGPCFILLCVFSPFSEAAL